jgi:hypothetical protein
VDKWQRVYRLQVETTPFSEQYIEMDPPFTCEFNITHSVASSLNNGHFTIYNLGPFTRKKIFQDKWGLSKRRRVIFSGGYGQAGQAGIVFIGDMLEAYSVREGVDTKTEIEALDSLFTSSNGVSKITFPPGSNQQMVFHKLAKDLPLATEPPIISPKFTQVYERGLVVEGNTFDKLVELVGPTGEVYFYQNHLVIMKWTDVMSGPVTVVKGDTGLLDSPRRQEALIEVKTLFEPSIKLGSIVQLESMEPVNNGQYKVVGFTHSGTISESVCGEATTVMQLYIGTEALKNNEVNVAKATNVSRIANELGLPG